MRAPAVAWVLVYVAAIVAANVLTDRFGLVPVGFGLVATAGTYAAGFALLARDFVQRFGGVPLTVGAIVLGLVLSWVLASPALAIASAVAFAIAELVDLVLYSAVRRRRSFTTSAGLSNLVSAPIDTVAFLAIAGFPITWLTVGGQLVGKLLWATAIPLLIYGCARALLREPLDTRDP